jgi:hypothetical protein
MENWTKERLDNLLAAICGEGVVDSWWVSPNKAFNMSAPIDVFHSENKMQVVKYILSHYFY